MTRMGHVEGLWGWLAKFCFLTWMVVAKVFTSYQFIKLYIHFVLFSESVLFYNGKVERRK